MTRNVQHSLLTKAKKNKNDEFYTQLCDIERELQHYGDCFKGKVVYCNCDDPTISNFYKYFVDNFKKLGLKKVISSCICPDFEMGNGYYYEYTGIENPYPNLSEVTHFDGNGDFRSQECVELLREADIVVTNPPFSLFREFVKLIVDLDKSFLCIGNVNSITYKEIFQLIQMNKAWLGINLGRGISGFIVPKHYELYGTEARIDENGNRIVATNGCLWLTNLDHKQRHEKIPLIKEYEGNESVYQKYDNYNGINVNKTKDIPKDYLGDMGVPLTFLHKFNPEQFEIVKFRKGDDEKDLRINGKSPYFRIIIRRIDLSK